MGGHLYSIDGLVMWRQALSLTFHQSFAFVPQIWWGFYIPTSARGIGASLQYVPGLIAFPWLAPYSPSGAAAYDFGLLYQDRLYTAAGAPVWAVITAAVALIVGLTARSLVPDRRAGLWAMAFYGIGSPALLGARGDFPQPLVALCWATGIYACIRLRNGGAERWLWLCAASVLYAVLTRPLEGSMLLPAVMLLLFPAWRSRPSRLAVPLAAWIIAVVITLLINWARFGSPVNFGYGSISWTIPIWVGFPYALLSPGRGALWQFPAMVLAVLGLTFLRRNRKPLEAAVLAGLPAVLFIESCTYFAWIDGWDWGFRLFQPALPLVAVLAGVGVVTLRGRLNNLLPVALLAGGLLWNIPAVVTDLLGGYAATYDNLVSWSRLDAYPPVGAWQFLHHIRATGAGDSAAVDIVWFRYARTTHWASLLPMAALIAAAATLWARAVRSNRLAP